MSSLLRRLGLEGKSVPQRSAPAPVNSRSWQGPTVEVPATLDFNNRAAVRQWVHQSFFGGKGPVPTILQNRLDGDRLNTSEGRASGGFNIAGRPDLDSYGSVQFSGGDGSHATVYGMSRPELEAGGGGLA